MSETTTIDVDLVRATVGGSPTYTQILIDPSKRALTVRQWSEYYCNGDFYHGYPQLEVLPEPDLPACAETFEMEVPTALLDRIFSGYDSHWDGQRIVGALDDDAEAAVDELMELVRDEAKYYVNDVQIEAGMRLEFSTVDSDVPMIVEADPVDGHRLLFWRDAGGTTDELGLCEILETDAETLADWAREAQIDDLVEIGSYDPGHVCGVNTEAVWMTCHNEHYAEVARRVQRWQDSDDDDDDDDDDE